MRDHVQPEQSSRVRSVLNIARYKKTVYSVAWIQFVMLACYGPFIVMAFLFHFGSIDYSTETRIANDVSICLLFLNSSLNPVLYCWRIKDVRQEVKNTIRQCLCCWVNLQWEKCNRTMETTGLSRTVPLCWYPNTRHSGRIHIVPRISYPYTLIVFCLNRVIKDVWRF